ncbi:hypothetical protein ACJX0J_005568, partial [Zea mays]
CAFCDSNETIQHLFINCHYAHFMWRLYFDLVNRGPFDTMPLAHGAAAVVAAPAAGAAGSGGTFAHVHASHIIYNNRLLGYLHEKVLDSISLKGEFIGVRGFSSTSSISWVCTHAEAMQADDRRVKLNEKLTELGHTLGGRTIENDLQLNKSNRFNVLYGRFLKGNSWGGYMSAIDPLASIYVKKKKKSQSAGAASLMPFTTPAGNTPCMHAHHMLKDRDRFSINVIERKKYIERDKTILPYIIHIYFFLQRMAKYLHMILLEE